MMETFFQRWSRRKRGAAPVEAAEPQSKPPHEKPAAPPTTPSRSAELPFDVSKLPPLDSITAETDIGAYLAPGVPAELTRAALRRAWAADPKIRDFIGLSESAWDFNAPEGVPGFGPLQMTDELRRQVAGMVGRSLGAETDSAPEAPTTAIPQPTLTPQIAENSTGNPENACSGDSIEAAATQQRAEPEQPTPQRRHGRALPT
jgi:hypothetical protein